MRVRSYEASLRETLVHSIAVSEAVQIELPSEQQNEKDLSVFCYYSKNKLVFIIVHPRQGKRTTQGRFRCVVWTYEEKLRSVFYNNVQDRQQMIVEVKIVEIREASTWESFHNVAFLAGELSQWMKYEGDENELTTCIGHGTARCVFVVRVRRC